MRLNQTLFTALSVIAFSLNTHYSTAQRHSGMVINVGVKKHFFSLKDSGGEKMENFSGNIAPFGGLSYAHVLGPKISATYEFDFSYAKGTYTEKYDPDYEYYPIINPQTESEIEATQDLEIEAKSIITLSVRGMFHYRVAQGFFVSAGIGYDRFGFSSEVINQSGQNYGKLPQELRSSTFNFNTIFGIGYATEKFRIDARYNLGLSNFIIPEKNRYDLDYWRYDRLTISQASLTFGYFIGAN